MFVKPAEGRMVRRPDTFVHLLAEGERVPDGDEFWIRRLRDGDVVKADEPSGFFEIGKHAAAPAATEETLA